MECIGDKSKRMGVECNCRKSAQAQDIFILRRACDLLYEKAERDANDDG